MSKRAVSRLGLLLALALAASAIAASSALAAPGWQIVSSADTTVAAGGELTYFVDVINRGNEYISSEFKVTTTLPPGLVGISGQSAGPFSVPFTCEGVAGEATFTCTGPFAGPDEVAELAIEVEAQPGAEGIKTAEFEVSGAGLGSAETADPTTISPTPPPFGIDAFDGSLLDPAGAPFSQAAGHPDDSATYLDFNTATDESPSPSPFGGKVGPHQAVEPVKDVLVDLPPGLVGNPAAFPHCTSGELANSIGITPMSLCPPESQVGTATVSINGMGLGNTVGPVPVFAMVPPPGRPARFGFNVLGTMVALDATVRSRSDYGLALASTNIPEGVVLSGTRVDFWGAPASPGHDEERSCPGQPSAGSPGGPSCVSEAPNRPFLRTPTSCGEEGLRTRVRTDSWAHPGEFAESSYRTHAAPGYPRPREDWGPEVGIDGCANVPFHPSLEVAATTEAADAPTGLDLHLRVPQDCWEHPEEICSSDLREAEVRLPRGMSLNPSAASGLGACTPAQVGLATPVGQAAPIHFDEAPAACPEDSKIGTVSIETPLLEAPLRGAVYLAQQGRNPFGSLLAIYLVAEGSGVVVKQAGEIVSDPATGRLATRFADAPQMPFSDLHVALFGGPRAALRTPPSCGSFAVSAKLTPWSGAAPTTVGSGFEVEGCPNRGFDPRLRAGTANPLAGTTSPFALKLSREDGSEEFAGLEVSLPPGLSGYLKGIPYCPEAALAAVSGEEGTGAAQEAQPSCPAASQLGTVTVGAGAGPDPFYTRSGRAYLAGPYKGAPLSLAVIAPAVAGPFDLGSVVVRNALRIDPTTAQITAVSDPLPTILHGVPLDLRDVRIELNRDHFTLNPTSCDEMSIGSTVTSTQGSTASPSQRFQVAGCEALRFGPSLSLRLQGGTRRSRHPALRAVLRAGAGEANIAGAEVSLPHSEFLAQSHLRTTCTRVQYAAGGGGGAGCPQGSVYGRARAYSPLLDQPLQGPVYLRSNGGERELPDLVASLGGQIHIDLVGYVDSDPRTGGLRTRFATAPDAPVSKFVLEMPGGAKSLLENSTDVCRGRHRAIVQMDAHNGKVHDFRPLVRARCGGGKRRGA